MRIFRRRPASVVLLLSALAFLPSPARASRDTECTQWHLDAPHSLPDGGVGVESSQCTCLSWSSYGDPPPPRYACDLCGTIRGFVEPFCLQRGADLPAAQGCSQSGGWAGLAVLGLLPGALLLRPRVR